VHKLLVAVCDGSFCNRTVLRAVVERTTLLVRCRKDARLCLPAAPGSRRVYDPVSFTPEQVRTDERIPWRSTRVYHGGQWRDVRYKEMAPLHWRAYGAQRTAAYLPLPCWRRHARGPSCQDLVAQLRREMDEHPEVLHCYGIKSGNDVLLRAAAA